MDRATCQFLHITQEQLDYITDNATMDELQKMMDPTYDEKATFSDIKRAIQIRDKYLKQNGLWIELDFKTNGE